MKNKVKYVDLSISEFEWFCPKCKEYNFVSLNDAIDGTEWKPVICDECDSAFETRFSS